MIRVALLSTDANPESGWGTFTYELCQNFFQREDIAFELHLPVGVCLNGEIPFSANIRKTLPPMRGGFRSRPHRMFQFFFPHVKTGNVDIVHTLIEFPYGVLGHNLGRRMLVPVIISTHGTYGVVPLLSWLSRWPFKQALQRAAAVTAPSSFTASAICQYSGLDRQIRVIPNAVNYELFQKPQNVQATRQKFGISPETRVVLGVGALKRRKGFDVLLRAFVRVVHYEPHTILVIVGQGDGSQLRELAASLGIAPYVRFLGWVPRDDLVALYQLCDVYAHLPRNENWHFEGFGIVYLEAAACGKPVVATRSGGVPEAVVDGETGILVAEEDDEEAAAAIISLLRDPDLARSMGEAGRVNASKHTWSWYADEIVSLYNAVLQKKRERL